METESLTSTSGPLKRRKEANKDRARECQEKVETALWGENYALQIMSFLMPQDRPTDYGNCLVKPLFMWAGGKTSLIKEYESRKLLPETFDTYIEPFLGGGAMFI